MSQFKGTVVITYFFSFKKSWLHSSKLQIMKNIKQKP